MTRRDPGQRGPAGDVLAVQKRGDSGLTEDKAVEVESKDSLLVRTAYLGLVRIRSPGLGERGGLGRLRERMQRAYTGLPGVRGCYELGTDC